MVVEMLANELVVIQNFPKTPTPTHLNGLQLSIFFLSNFMIRHFNLFKLLKFIILINSI